MFNAMLSPVKASVGADTVTVSPFKLQVETVGVVFTAIWEYPWKVANNITSNIYGFNVYILFFMIVIFIGY